MENKHAVYEFHMGTYFPLMKNHLKIGGDNGIEKIEVTNRYILRNDKPWIPIMGEYQFSRAQKSEWRRELCKMKAGGVNVIAFYVIWIHHEETEGQISFEGNLNIREFVETCYELGLHVSLRIGPWIHGEVKNGGFPDWLVNRQDIELRTNHPEYLKYCKKWYAALAEQLKGLMFKDGKPLFAIQVDNELVNNEAHLSTLIDIAKEVGFDAPIYTATGWGADGDARVPRDRVIPLYGGYPEAPWEDHTDKLPPNLHYFFSPIRNDSNIGSDLLGKSAGDVSKGGLDYNLYPYATCELGGGMHNTYHRRPIIEEKDITAITNVKLGSGINLLGYYLYHGGKNPIGVTTTMNESKKSGYANDLPIIDYDFQAQLGSWGAVRKHYRSCRTYALFLEDFGEEFAVTVPYFQKNTIDSMYDTESLRYSLRLHENSGYVFINNFSRKDVLKEHENVKFAINGYVFPHGNLRVKNEEFGFIPYNMQLGSVVLNYAMMQPVCKNHNAYFFFAPFNNCDEFCFKRDTVSNIIADGDLQYTDDEIIVKHVKGKIELIDADGEKVVIEILTKEQAHRLSRHDGKLYLSECDTISVDGIDYVYGTNVNNLKCQVYTANGFADCKIADVKELSEEVTVEEIDSFIHKYMEEFELCDNDDLKYYSLTLPENRDNLILCMNITGDIAQLYADDELIADTFLNGRNWYVGPDDRLNSKRLVLVVNRLSPENKYLETENKSGLNINQIIAKRLYVAEIL